MSFAANIPPDLDPELDLDAAFPCVLLQARVVHLAPPFVADALVLPLKFAYSYPAGAGLERNTLNPSDIVGALPKLDDMAFDTALVTAPDIVDKVSFPPFLDLLFLFIQRIHLPPPHFPVFV
jgi:hypothetical protein